MEQDAEVTERRAQELYAAAREDFEVQLPWADLPDVQRNYWREIAKGNAGASMG